MSPRWSGAAVGAAHDDFGHEQRVREAVGDFGEATLPRLTQSGEIGIAEYAPGDGNGRRRIGLRDWSPTDDIVAARPPVLVALPERVGTIAGAVVHGNSSAKYAIEGHRNRVRRLRKKPTVVSYLLAMPCCSK